MAATAAAGSSSWYIGPKADLLIGCGLWSLPFLLITHQLNLQYGVALAFAFYILSFVCNYPHYMATIYRAYGTKADFEKYRFFTIYVTALFVGTAAITHTSHMLFGDRVNLVPYFVTFYLLWSPYHYTGQNFGLTMMFARKRGINPTLTERNLLQWGYVSGYLIMLVSIQAASGGADPNLLQAGPWIQKHFDNFGFWVNSIRWALLVFFAGSVTYVLFRWIPQVGFRRAIPVTALACTQGMWFLVPALYEILGSAVPAVYYSTGTLAFMHCAQYLWINFFYARKETEAGLRGSGVWRPWRYFGILIVGGMALFVPGPWFVSRAFSFDFTESFLIFTALVNIHHFMLDGAIWKLRDGRIAQLLLGKGTAASSGAGNAASEYLTGAASWLAGRSPVARTIRYGGIAGLLLVTALDVTYQFATRKHADFDEILLAKKLNPDDTKVHVRYAELLASGGALEEAISAVKEAIKINPYSPAARRLLPALMARLGEVEGNQGLMRAAYDELRLLPMLFSPDLGTLMLWGRLGTQFGDVEEAIARLEEARGIEPANLDVMLSLADTYLAAGRNEESVAAYKQYLAALSEGFDRSPETIRRSVVAGLKMCDGLALLGRTAEAADIYPQLVSTALRIGDTPLASQATMRFADLAESSGDVEGALRLMRGALQISQAVGDVDSEGRAWFNLAQFLADHAADPTLALAGYARAEALLAATPDLARLSAAHRERLQRELGPAVAAKAPTDLDRLVSMIADPSQQVPFRAAKP
ncbi:MAG: tetratricopeptide repeat protein [Candidatus Sumerlaeia bacterium]|nr:tetratricopeptide repeat protein [Candidatus Sumerlaeia bacterium]